MIKAIISAKELEDTHSLNQISRKNSEWHGVKKTHNERGSASDRRAMGGLRWRAGYAKVAMLGIRSLSEQTYEG